MSDTASETQTVKGETPEITYEVLETQTDPQWFKIILSAMYAIGFIALAINLEGAWKLLSFASLIVSLAIYTFDN